MLTDHTLNLGPHISNAFLHHPTILLYVPRIFILNSNSIPLFYTTLQLTFSSLSADDLAFYFILKSRVKRNCLIFLEACLHMNIYVLPSMNVSVPISDSSLSQICTGYHKPLLLKEFFLKCSLSLQHQYSLSTGLFLSTYIQAVIVPILKQTTNQNSK